MSATFRTAFISGPITPPSSYFPTHYGPQLLTAIAAGDSFVVGPAAGIDTVALQFLVSQRVPSQKITVYLAEFQELALRDGLKWFEDLGGNIKVEGITTGQRDAAMTRDSDYDVLRIMKVEEQKELYGAFYYARVSNTEKNERRRMALK